MRAAAPCMRPAVRSRRGLRATLAHGIVFALILLFSAGAAIAQGARATAAPGPLVAAASDLRFALDELAAAFRRDSGTAVRIVYGSSGNFRRQIAEGAPFELFLSADEDYVVALAREGRLVDAGTLYGIGRLALVIPRGRRCARRHVGGPGRRRAQPADREVLDRQSEHAPYGRAAQQALTAVGAWETLRPRLVLGRERGAGDAVRGFGVHRRRPRRAVAGDGPRGLGTAAYAVVPAALHSPLRQRMALTRRATPAARAFFEFLQRPASRQVLQRYGFALPGE
ncbi:MAG: molybdate ABC transporter substrate-binding protein [Betaproteobacteria bacterium]|nr:molybdate ABC transporter substrate-binding protein [Betaproteobacteria bacterium]